MGSGRPGQVVRRGIVLLLAGVIAWGIARADTQPVKGADSAGAQVAAQAAVGGNLPAVQAPDGAVGWDESAGLEILNGDTIDPASRIFDSPDYKQQLLVPGSAGPAYVLDLKTKSLRALPSDKLAWTDDEKPFPDVSTAQDAGSFTSDGGVIRFTANGATWTIQPEPPLVGRISLEDLKAQKPDYVHAASLYKPDPAAVQALHNVSANTHIVVFFGTWCTYCKHWLPRFMKTLEEAGNPNITVEFYGMSDDQKEPADAIARYKVSLTPTFIVLQAGKELGRIEENPQQGTIEADLADMLGGR